jgi:hypothetical protein
VLCLEQGTRAPGEHHLVLDGSLLGAGIYLVRLESGNFRTIKKIINNR